jgi:hypothetical protein
MGLTDVSDSNEPPASGIGMQLSSHFGINLTMECTLPNAEIRMLLRRVSRLVLTISSQLVVPDYSGTDDTVLALGSASWCQHIAHDSIKPSPVMKPYSPIWSIIPREFEPASGSRTTKQQYAPARIIHPLLEGYLCYLAIMDTCCSSACGHNKSEFSSMGRETDAELTLYFLP